MAFAVNSVEEACNYLVTSGIAVEPIRVDEYTDKKYTFFCDPDGLPLDLYEQVDNQYACR